MTFICDECADAKNFVEDCNKAVSGTVYRYPAALESKKDPEMLPDLLSKDRCLLTVDVLIAEENASYIPSENAGIVVVRLRRPVRPMTHRLMAQMISKFKTRMPEWRHLDLRNIHLKVCEDCAMVSSLPLSREKIIVDYADVGFAYAIDNAVKKSKVSALAR